MSKFKYYVTDLFDGRVKGTNSDTVARDLADSSDFFVVNSETGSWLTEGGEDADIKEGYLTVGKEEG